MDAIANKIDNIEQITAQIIAYKEVTAKSILEIGRLLIEAKEQLPHGQWGDWLKHEVEFSERSAQNFMRVAREYASNPQLVADLGSIRKAVALLEVPAEERETFAEEHHATEISARELEEAIKARDQAQQALAEKDSALKAANGTLEGKLAELAAARKELEELKARPIDVAVETVVDEQAVKQAAKDAKAKAEAKAAKQIADAEAKVKTLEDELAKAKASSDTERADAEAKVIQLQKELAMAKNEDLTAARMCFDRIKEECNRMHGYILKFRAAGNEQGLTACRKSAQALAQYLTQISGEVEL